MSRWTKARDRVRNVTVGVIKKPFTDVSNTLTIIRSPKLLAPSYVLSQDRATTLDNLALGEGVADLRAVRNTGRVVGAAIGLFYGGEAVYSAAGGGSAAAPELLAGPGAEATVGGTSLIGSGSTTAGSAGIFGSGITTGEVSTAGLVFNALRRGNIGAAVDALTGSDWGSQYLPNFGGGGPEAGIRSGGMPDSGSPGQYGRGGMSPLVLAGIAIVLIVGAVFLARKIHHA